ECAVEKRAAPPLPRDLAANDEVRLASLVERRFDCRTFFARADEIARGPPAQEQSDGADEHGLAGARFAGQDVEARGELDVSSVYDRQAPDAKVAQHELGGGSPRMGRGV